MFLDRAADRERLPVVLLSGFLGSGKTTLVNALLRDPRLAETAVAINEFGEVPLDQLLVGHDRDATVVMANGCLCCNLAGDMEGAVMRIFARRQSGDLPSFRRLIVEPSGLADPAPIAQAILRNPVMSRALRLASIVTTVDALFAETQVSHHAEFRKQVALADTVVLTKCDLTDEPGMAQAVALVRNINPTARLVHAVQGEAYCTDLLPACFIDPAAPDDLPPREVPQVGHAHGHAAHAVSISLISEKPLPWRAFDDFLRGIRLSLGERLLRVKGIVHVAETGGPVVVQGVHHVLHAPVALDAWPDADHRTRVVLILDGVDAGWVTKSWAEWLQEKPGVATTAPPVQAPVATGGTASSPAVLGPSGAFACAP
jgi:G3E family GTPase